MLRQSYDRGPLVIMLHALGSAGTGWRRCPATDRALRSRARARRLASRRPIRATRRWQSMCYPHRYHPLTCLQALAVVRVAARATPRVGRAPEPGLRRRSSASRCSRRYLPKVCTAARRRCREHLRFEFHLELEVWRLCPFNWACARTLRQKKNHSKRSNWRRTVDV